jgi:hypothetical protein
MMKLPRPGCWYRFTPEDWQFIGECLGLNQSNKNSLAAMCDDPDVVRFVADHPKLFQTLLVGRGTTMLSPELFFFVVVRHTLKEIGVEDMAVADYIAVVCADHGMSARNSAPQPKAAPARLYSIDYLQALETAGSHEKFFIHVQCANQFMVLTCLFPSFLHHRAERRGAPDVEFYEGMVVTHLEAAGRHALAEEFALDEVLMRLSGAFPPVRRAMNHTLREYLYLGTEPNI